MVKFLLAAVTTVLIGGFASAQVVFMPRDEKSFTVGEKDIVRVPGAKGSTGFTSTVKVTGAAKAEERKTAGVAQGRVVPGGDGSEFDIMPTGKGVVKVVVTTKGRGKDAKEEEKVYEFEVK